MRRSQTAPKQLLTMPENYTADCRVQTRGKIQTWGNVRGVNVWVAMRSPGKTRGSEDTALSYGVKLLCASGAHYQTSTYIHTYFIEPPQRGFSGTIIIIK